MTAKQSSTVTSAKPIGTALYLVALGLIASLAVGTHVLIDSLASRQQSTARVVNMAGRQSMLSQRIAWLALQWQDSQDPVERAILTSKLDEACATMERSHAALSHGSAELDIPPPPSALVASVYTEAPFSLDDRVTAFVANARALLAETTPSRSSAHLAAIVQTARDPILQALDEAVSRYQAYSEATVAQLRTGLLSVLALILLTLLLEALFIFRPFFSRLQKRERQYANLMALLKTKIKSRTADLRLADSVVKNTSEGVIVTNALGQIISVNPAFCQISGYAEKEVLGKNANLLKSDRHEPVFFAHMWNELREHRHWEGEIWNRRRDGEVYLAWLTINAIPKGPRGECYVAVFRDITQNHLRNERLQRLAFRDALTGLANRPTFLERAHHALERAKREASGLAVIFLDLDGFKHINDTLGHDAGDQLLQVVAIRLRTCLRADDTVARFGGDEFVILLEGILAPQDCLPAVEAMIETIRSPMSIKGHTVSVSMSMGVACYPKDADAVATLLKHADTAMYQAKQAGKNTYRLYDPAAADQEILAAEAQTANETPDPAVSQNN